MSKLVYILNGANLDMLGQREPALYGSATLADLERLCHDTAADLGLGVIFRQTNAESELIGWIHEAHTKASAVIINAAGWSHTSVVILDALKILSIPIYEVHITNPVARDPYRRHSFVSEAATGVIAGFGVAGYGMALRAAAKRLAEHEE